MFTEATDTKEELEELKLTIEKMVKSEDLYKSEIRLLKEQIDFLKDKLFGRKSEKLPKDDQQLTLFEETDESECQSDENDDEGIVVPSYKRKKRGRKPLPSNLPRIEVIHDLEEQDKLCECGCEKIVCGRDTSEQLDIVPPKMQVIQHIRLKYACKGCEGVESTSPTVMIAPRPVQLIPKSNATTGLIAHILTSKFVDGLPFYRQEKQFSRIGADITRASMCNWALKASEECKPLYELLQQEILRGPLINADETTVQVMKEPGRSDTSKSYMWIFRGGPPDKPSLIFQYEPTRSGDVPRAFLRNYKGYVQTDGYAAYNFLDHTKSITHIGCWAHARRMFNDASKAVKKYKKKNKSSADEALEFIGKLYAIEKEARKGELSFEDIFKERQEKTKPILDEFKKWLSEKSLKTPPKGLLGKAISYTLKQWNRLIGYTEEGFIRPDNNLAENAIRPFVVGRKNWLFSGSPKGAEGSAIFYSLIETAKANKLEPYKYLKYVLWMLPRIESTEECKNLLPQNIDRDKLDSYLDCVLY